MDKLGGQKSVDKFGGRDAEKKYVIFLNLRLKLFFIDLAGPGDPGGPGAVFGVDLETGPETIIIGISAPWSSGCTKRHLKRMKLKPFYGPSNSARFTRRPEFSSLHSRASSLTAPKPS